MSSSVIAVGVNADCDCTARPKSNVGRLTAALPSILFSASTCAASWAWTVVANRLCSPLRPACLRAPA